MDKEKRTHKIAYWLCAIVVLVVLCAFAYPYDNKAKTAEYEVVCFGDSVPGLVRDETGVVALLGAETGKSIFNAALGGTCVGRIDQGNQLDNGWDSLSLCALTKAIRYGDFIPQRQNGILKPATEYFQEVVTGLEQINFKNINTVLIFQGVNDFYSGVPIQNTGNPRDEYTFSGGLCSAIEDLKAVNPKVRIILVSPPFTWYVSGEKTSEDYDCGYGNFGAYVEAEKQIAADYGIEFIDLYHYGYEHTSWDDWKTYTVDGIHPNEEGRSILVEKIAKYLTEE